METTVEELLKKADAGHLLTPAEAAIIALAYAETLTKADASSVAFRNTLKSWIKPRVGFHRPPAVIAE